MKPSNRLLCLLCLAVSAVSGTSIRAADSIGYFEAVASDPAPVAGRQYYTRCCFMYEKGVYETTNYWRGTLIPINTQVTLLSVGDENMLLRLGNGEVLKVVNVERFSRRDMTHIARAMLSPRLIPIEKFDEATANAIKGGNLKMGMTKEQVVMTRGFPPGHKTPSTDADVWTYWSSRFVVDTLVFDHGALTQGRGVR